MRLKQLLGVLVLLLTMCLVAVAAGSQLTDVNAAAKGNATVVTVKATGSFTHNEYRPADNLLLVDLTGVSAGKLLDKEQSINLPGIKSYRVLSYKGANGADVTRLEIALADANEVAVDETPGGLQVRVSSKTEAAVAVPASAPAATAPQVVGKADLPVEKSPAPTVRTEALTTASISRVSVVRGRNGMEVHIQGASSAKTMKVTDPDRIVLDVENAVPTMTSKNILVNSPDLKSVRIGRYQAEPPVTRIVLDLKGDRDFKVVPGTNSMTVKLEPVAVAAHAPVMMPALETKTPEAVATAPAVTSPTTAQSTTPTPVEPVVQATSTPAPVQVKATEQEMVAKAQPAVFVEPGKPAEVPVPKPALVTPDPTVRAAEAAATMAHSNQQAHKDPMPPASAAPKPATNLALEQQQEQAAAQPAGPRYTGEPISVNLKDVDLKDFFRLIHDISGLNVVLDPNVKGSLTLVLDDVPWDQALDIVLQNNGLDRQLHGNVLRIATLETMRREADAKRAQAEAEALAVNKQTVTRFLSYAHAKDVMPTVKKFLSQRGDVIADERTNALIIQDIPSVIPEVDRLLAQLDRKTQEVEIEARVVAATRTFAREIGVQLGFGWGNGPTAVGGGLGQTSGITNPVSAPSYLLNTGQLPLFTNLGLTNPTSALALTNATNNYRIDAILTAAESKGLARILSRPRVVTQNNITAVVKQGFRIPVVTQAQLNGPPTVTYVEALLRLTVTPQITVENTIFLAVDVENTTPDKANGVNGNPALLTQQATTQVLVTDGGTVVIGGVIQTQNSVTVSQVPFLGDLPVLGNLFKKRGVSTQTQELIFFITPKIIQT